MLKTKRKQEESNTSTTSNKKKNVQLIDLKTNDSKPKNVKDGKVPLTQNNKKKENELSSPKEFNKPKKEFTKSKDFGKNKKDLFKNKKDFAKGKKPEFVKGKKPEFVKGKKPEFIKGKKTDFIKGKKGENTKFTKDQNSTEKPKWSEMRKEKKQLRIIRKKAKSTAEVFEISHKAKLLSAQIQRKTVKASFKENACAELHGLLKGQYKSIALTHDLSRVIQVLLKNSSEQIRDEITHELMDIMVQMVQSKYAQHSVKRILKYGSETIRHEVLKTFFGHIVSLAAHTISAPVLDYAYGEFATPKEKLHMQQEFYGEMYKNSKDDSVKTLSDAYKGSPEMKPAILSSCKANIQRILDKNLHDSELLHSVLYDYMRECSNEERAELITTLCPLIVPLSNSLPGVNAASMCVWQGTNKDKKTIIKVVKEHAASLSKHKSGYRLLLAMFDAVDDTVLLRKAVVAAILTSLKDVAKDHWGKMTLHWLVKPNDKAAFHPTLIKFLKDGAATGTSKKDADIRVTELREAVLPGLKKEIEDDPEFWLSDPTITLLTATILSIESSQEMVSALARAICRPDWQVNSDGKEVNALEDAGMHMCLKKMAALDKERDDFSLGDALCNHLTDDALNKWLSTNRGCFFVVKLIESNKEAVSTKLIQLIKPFKNLLHNQNSAGAKVLLQKVDQ